MNLYCINKSNIVKLYIDIDINIYSVFIYNFIAYLYINMYMYTKCIYNI